MAPPPYGIPYVGVASTQALSPVTFTGYASESDKGAPGMPVGYPIPEEAKTQPNYIENAVAGGNTTGDRHMLLVDRDRWILYELYGTHWTGSRWEAMCGAVFDLKSNYRRPRGDPGMPGPRRVPLTQSTTRWSKGRIPAWRCGQQRASVVASHAWKRGRVLSHVRLKGQRISRYPAPAISERAENHDIVVTRGMNTTGRWTRADNSACRSSSQLHRAISK
jgi:hypothetical protein